MGIPVIFFGDTLPLGFSAIITYFSNFFAKIKCFETYKCNAVSYGNTRKIFATVKRFITNTCYAIRNSNALKAYTFSKP